MTAENPPTATFDEVLSALVTSHDRLVATVRTLSAEDVTADSYDDDWSIAQVLSHIGSGAEIFGLFVDSAATGDGLPGGDAFTPIWDRWNAKAPADQASDALVSDAVFVKRLGEISAEDRDRLQFDLFGSTRTLTDVALMRLGEHAVHTWDVAVALDPTTTLDSGAVALLVDRLGDIVARAGKADSPVSVSVTTTDHERSYLLKLGPAGGSLTCSEGPSADADAALTLPAEAFVRLIYGRLDPDHTPPLDTNSVELGLLRKAFPGF